MASSLWSLGTSIAFLAVIGCDAQLTSQGGSPEDEERPLVNLKLAADIEGRPLTMQCQDVIDDAETTTYFLSDPEYNVWPNREVDVHTTEGGWIDRCLNDFSEGDTEARIAVMWVSQHDCEAEDRTVFASEVLVYSEHDIAPGTLGERFLGGRLTAGPHVLRAVRCPDPSMVDVQCLEPTEDDLDTDFNLPGPGVSSPNTLPPRLHVQ